VEPLPRLRYPSPVTRILILVLLIVLLPLRGWSAERMADHMAATGASTAHAMGAMPADCPMMMQMAAMASLADKSFTDDGGTTSTPTDRTCQSCQLCMSLAAPETPAVQAVSPAPQSVAVHRADSFASAYLPRSIKPPIS
jgi:hypothetical protein